MSTVHVSYSSPANTYFRRLYLSRAHPGPSSVITASSSFSSHTGKPTFLRLLFSVTDITFHFSRAFECGHIACGRCFATKCKLRGEHPTCMQCGIDMFRRPHIVPSLQYLVGEFCDAFHMYTNCQQVIPKTDIFLDFFDHHYGRKESPVVCRQRPEDYRSNVRAD